MKRRRRNGKNGKFKPSNEKAVYGESSTGNKSKRRRRKMNSERNLEVFISHGNLKDKVSEFLYALGVVYDDEEIVDIKFGALNGDIVPLVIKLKPEVEFIKHV